MITPIGFYQLWKSIQTLSGDEKRRQINFLIVSFLGYFGGGLSFFPVYDIPIPQYGLFLLPLYPFGKAYFMGSSGLLFDEERMAQAAHQDKLAALGILTASINHEIRGPLFAMRGAVEMEETSEPMRVKLLSQIDRLTAIVSRLTHFAKKGVDEAAKIEPLNFSEILADVEPLLKHQFHYQEIQFTKDIAENFPPVLADRRYLEEILFNLLINACQALKNTPNPTIKLSARILEDQRLTTKDYRPPQLSFPRRRESSSVIKISIEDNGQGISSDQIKYIFKPFHTTKQDGTGLGLYITKQLVEKCGGKIEVESDSGKGAKFIVSLPSLWGS